jgi:putative dimethyl sulfoxide reductase chaperone
MNPEAAIHLEPDLSSPEPIPKDSERWIARAETYLCLARAFLPPTQAGILAALREDLLEDLETLHKEVAISAATPGRIAALRSILAEIPDDQALLREHSRLFLTPPAPAMLNLGFYLDGGIMGNSTRQMEAYYQRHGLERDPNFRDLPDHLALNLQFLAWVFAGIAEFEGVDNDAARRGLQDARDLIARYTLPGLQALIGRLLPAIDAHGLSQTYGELAHILTDVLKRDLAVLSARLPGTAVPTPSPENMDPETLLRVDTDPEARLACRICGNDFVAGEALAEMIGRLQAAGLATEHLAVCPDCRAETMGMRPLAPPAPKR